MAKKIKPATAPGDSLKAQLYNIMKYVLWALMLFVFLRGVTSILFPAKPVIEQHLEIPHVVNEHAQNFAQAFAHQYYTFSSREGEKHREAIRPFVSQSLLSDHGGLKLNSIQGSYQVLNSFAWSVEQRSENQADILVRVDIEHVDKDGEQLERFHRYLQVPVAWNGSNYYVFDYPTVLPDPNYSSGSIVGYPEQMAVVKQEIQNEIDNALADFLRNFSDAPPSQLKYFMADGKEVNGYNGDLSFKRIVSNRVYDLVNVGSVSGEPVTKTRAYAVIEFLDSNNLQHTTRMTIDFIYKEGRWYVEQYQGGFQI